MNRRQKLVQQQYLNNEKAVINRLQSVYSQSLKDINKTVFELDSSIDALQKAYNSITDDEVGELAATFLKSKRVYTPEEAKETLQSMIQSKVYQKQYQTALQKQVGGILDKMHQEEFLTVSDYLDTCYEDGFIGTIFDMHGQGVPMMMPIDQEAMVRAVQLESKINQGLYNRLGEDVDMLKKKITAQVSRSISTGMTYAQTAKQIADQSKIGYNNAIRIARTEGHRVANTATMDACYKAKDKGANVVKQWDSTLDSRTRESHVAVDGEIRELDESFSNGLEFPGDPSGRAAEVVNCRCALLQRARWAVGGSFTKMNNFTKQLETFDSPEEYDEFKKAFFSKENRQYMGYVEKMEEKYNTMDFAKVLDRMSDREYNHYSNLLANNPVYRKNNVDDFKKTYLKSVAKPVTEIISTPEQARHAINKMFNVVDRGLGGFSDDQLVVAAQRWEELESRFGCVAKGKYSLEVVSLDGRDKTTFAYVRSTKTTGNNLVLNSRYYGVSVEKLSNKEGSLVSNNWMMPCSKEQLKHYTITHEYGHMVEFMEMENRLGANYFDKKAREKVEKDIWLEIVSIAKEQNSDFTVRANISDYGKSHFAEAFAETFTNALCGEPNELGNAMNIWLERRGY